MVSAKDVWVVAEQNQVEPEDACLEIISKARQLADKLGEEVKAAVIGSSKTELALILASYGADKVYFVDHPLLSEYSVELYVEALSRLFEDESPNIVLLCDSVMGRHLASRLAVRLKTGLVSECVSLELSEEGLLIQTKLTYGGRVSSTIICPNSRPQMATIKPGVMERKKPDANRKPEVKTITPQLEQREPRSIVKGFVKADPEKLGLDESEVIVAGGRGLGNIENFQLLWKLAKQLGGVIAGSLAAVDEGWIPRSRLVGQTGMTVAPKLYIACGISGSNYHVLGMKDSRVIVVINKDRNASIFKLADLGLVGDAAEVIPAIINKLRELAGKASQ